MTSTANTMVEGSGKSWDKILDFCHRLLRSCGTSSGLSSWTRSLLDFHFEEVGGGAGTMELVGDVGIAEKEQGAVGGLEDGDFLKRGQGCGWTPWDDKFSKEKLNYT
jgi:hypothetical protein